MFVAEQATTGGVMTDATLHALVSALPYAIALVTDKGYPVGDDGVVIARGWDGWWLTVHTTAVDGDSVVFEWSYDDVLQMLEDVPHHAK